MQVFYGGSCRTSSKAADQAAASNTQLLGNSLQKITAA
jgi:hypothetical protein